jgi:CRP-like cAMP-binding protein
MGSAKLCVLLLPAIAHASLAESEVSDQSHLVDQHEPTEAPLLYSNDMPDSSIAPGAQRPRLGMYATAHAVVRMKKIQQKRAEAAMRVDPLNRTPEQLQHIAQYVQGATPCQDMNAPDVLKVARAIVLVRTTANEVVVKEGALGSAFFVVLAGEFAVWQKRVSESPYNECALTTPACLPNKHHVGVQKRADLHGSDELAWVHQARAHCRHHCHCARAGTAGRMDFSSHRRRYHSHWGGKVNHVTPSAMFGERGLLENKPRNATITQCSAAPGRLLQLSGLDYQAIRAGREPLAVQAKVRIPRKPAALAACFSVTPREVVSGGCLGMSLCWHVGHTTLVCRLAHQLSWEIAHQGHHRSSACQSHVHDTL